MTREKEQQILHKTIWGIANDLRGNVDGWDFKSYVLDMMFYRFISENISEHLNRIEREAGNPNFDYAQLSDDDAEFGREITVDEKGFFILPSELFVNVRRNAYNDNNLNETIDRVFKNIESSAIGTSSEADIKGLFNDLDISSDRLGGTVIERNKNLVKLLDAIGDMPLGQYNENQSDTFGDAYEYLMGMYASDAGRSGGQYFTPQEVSELLVEIASASDTPIEKVYDPACGSGSLLLKFAKALRGDKDKIKYYGQEVMITTYNLCRINMFLHNVNYTNFDIRQGDTLLNPLHLDAGPFDAIVSNPPYSQKWEGKNNPLLVNDSRFSPAGVLAPVSKSDLAFTMHILSSLSVTGTAAIVEFPGVLYRGGAEQKIRNYMIDNNYVDAVIQLPNNLFYGVSIATCIIVLKKNKSDNSVLFIDGSQCFERMGNKNKLNEGNRETILKAYINRKNIPHFTELVSNESIAENDYNLSVSSFVEEKDETVKVDIDVLNLEIKKIVTRGKELRSAIDLIVNELENKGDLK